MTKAKTTGSLKVSRTRKAAGAASPSAGVVGSKAAKPFPPPTGKLSLIADLLRRPNGAGIAELAGATGWQAHSVRGALAGALKIKHGLTITSEKTEGGRVYRVAAPAAEGTDA